MKKYIFLYFLLSVTLHSFSQNVQVTVTPLLGLNPSPYIERFYNKPFVILVNNTRQTLSVKLIGKIEGNNGLYWRTNANFRPATPILLQPGNNVIVASNTNLDFLAPNNVETNLSPARQKQLLINGFLPQGNYRFCIRVLNYANNSPLSLDDPIGCSNINISYIKPPQILSPINLGAIVGQFPIISWATPIGNIAGSRITYNLYVVKLKMGQNPNEALQNAVNYRIGTVLFKENITTNFYNYQPSDISLEDGQVYALQVVAKGNNLFFENDGKSEVITFTYRKQLQIKE